jgi:hypothetical protein
VNRQARGGARRGANEPKGALEKSTPFFQLVPSPKTDEQRLTDFFRAFVLPIPGATLFELSQAPRDWLGRVVTLNEVKGLVARFFAALRMTLPPGRGVKGINVL